MLKNVVDKEKKANANNLKTISHATDEQTALDCLDEVGFIREKMSRLHEPLERQLELDQPHI